PAADSPLALVRRVERRGLAATGPARHHRDRRGGRPCAGLADGRACPRLYRLGLSSTVVAAGHRGRPGRAGTTAPAGRAPDRAGLRPAAHAEWPADAIVLRGRTGLGLVVPASPRPAAGGARPCLQRPDAAGLPDGRHPAFTGSERAVPGLTRRDESAGESVEEYLELVGQGR